MLEYKGHELIVLHSIKADIEASFTAAKPTVVKSLGLPLNITVQVRLNIPCCVYGKFMVCTAHRLQCKRPHFPKHVQHGMFKRS